MTVDASLILNGLIYCFIGAFAGLMAGALGVGGGVVVVPGLLFVFQNIQSIPQDGAMQVAAGSSLAVMIFTSLSSLRAHLKLGEVLWGVYKKMAPGLFLGTLVGAILANLIPTYWLKILFASFLILVAVKMVMDIKITHPQRTPAPWINRLFSFAIGIKSGLLGIGGGLLLIPYLSYCGIPIRQIASVSNLCTLTVALVGALSFLITGHEKMGSVPYASGYVYWPAVLWIALPSYFFAPIGAKLNYIVPVKLLNYCFIVIVLVTAVYLIYK